MFRQPIQMILIATVFGAALLLPATQSAGAESPALNETEREAEGAEGDIDQESAPTAEAEPAEPTENAPLSVRVKVHVTIQGTEQPVRNADVALRSLREGESYRKEARSYGRGIAEFVDVPAGSALITVTKPKFKTWRKPCELSQNPSTIETQLKEKN